MSTCIDSYSTYSSSSSASGSSFTKKKQYSAIVHVDPTPDQIIPITEKDKEDLKFELACQLAVGRSQNQDGDDCKSSFNYNDIIQQNQAIQVYRYSSGAPVYQKENQHPISSRQNYYHNYESRNNGQMSPNMYVGTIPNHPQQGYPPLAHELHLRSSAMNPGLNHGMPPNSNYNNQWHQHDYTYQQNMYPSDILPAGHLDSCASFQIPDDSESINQLKHDSSDDELEKVSLPYSFRTASFSDIDSEKNSASFMKREPEKDSVRTDFDSESTNKQSNRTASTQPCQDHPMNNKRTPVKVFITYAASPGDKENAKHVLQVADTLLQNGIQVNTDLMEQNVKSMSISEWLDVQISENDFVLVCISPQYKRIIEEGGEGISCEEKALHTTYIYRRIHSEYITNGSKNYRFLPILINGGTAEHAPQWLLDTRIYKWPEEFEDIIYRLFRIEKYVKPQIGRAPKCVIKKYGD